MIDSYNRPHNWNPTNTEPTTIESPLSPLDSAVIKTHILSMFGSHRGSLTIQNILEDFENASPYVCTFLANKKLLAGFNVQPRFGMNKSLI